MNAFPKAKVINTGNLILQLIKKLDFPKLDSLPLMNYFKYVEPMLMENVLTHLEHEDVILDTHFYYLLPGISAKSLFRFSNMIKTSILVLVEDDPESIQEANRDDKKWFQDINNIKEDLLLNKYSFRFYHDILKEFSEVKVIKINLKDKGKEERIQKLIGDLK